MVLGTCDVMRLADAEFGLRVSREIARQWLEICGAAAPSCELLRIESANELERRCGPFLRASGVDYRMDISDEKLLPAFLGFFPHMRAPDGPRTFKNQQKQAAEMHQPISLNADP